MKDKLAKGFLTRDELLNYMKHDRKYDDSTCAKLVEVEDPENKDKFQLLQVVQLFTKLDKKMFLPDSD